VGAPEEGTLSDSGIDTLGCRTIEPLRAEEKDQLAESVVFRIMRGDDKGRPLGTPRNPRVPLMEEFNPQIGELHAGEIASKIGGCRHGLFPEQVARVRQFANEDLIRFRPEDPISGYAGSGTFSITGGHHRLAEIIRRVKAGELPADTPIRILFHD
jgi:hypothetical protein